MTSLSCAVISLYVTTNNLCLGTFHHLILRTMKLKQHQEEVKVRKPKLIIKYSFSEFLSYCSVANFVFLYCFVNTFKSCNHTVCSLYRTGFTGPQAVIKFLGFLFQWGMALHYSFDSFSLSWLSFPW